MQIEQEASTDRCQARAKRARGMASGAFVGAIFGFTVALYSNAVILSRIGCKLIHAELVGTFAGRLTKELPLLCMRCSHVQRQRRNKSLLHAVRPKQVSAPLAGQEATSLPSTVGACSVRHHWSLCRWVCNSPSKAAQHLLCIIPFAYGLQALHMQQPTLYLFVPCEVEPGMCDARLCMHHLHQQTTHTNA